jgi:nucleoside-diphosphate-sugar epimerase
MTNDCVLVTGAFGLVGSAVVAALADQGRRVVATDLDIPSNRKRAQEFAAGAGVEVRWADLTSTTDVDALLAAVAPTAIIHLAAIIPPFCYARPRLAQAVNVMPPRVWLGRLRRCRSRLDSCKRPASRSMVLAIRIATMSC